MYPLNYIKTFYTFIVYVSGTGWVLNVCHYKFTLKAAIRGLYDTMRNEVWIRLKTESKSGF